MKIKGAIISGILLLGVGLCVTGYATTRDDFNFEEISKSQFEIEENTFDADIVGIKCDIKAENIKIVPTEEDEIKIKSKESEELSYTFTIDEENYLNVVQKINKSWGFIDWNIFNINKTTEPLIIELPTDHLYNLNLDVNAANLEVKDLDFKTIDLKCNAGNIDMINCDIDVLNVDIDAGNLDFKDFTINELKCKLNAGNADFKVEITKSAELTCNAGNIDIILKGGRDKYSVNGVGNGDIKIITKKNVSDIDIDFE